MTVAVSSWALHQAIGTAYWNSPEKDVFEESRHSETGIDLMDLPGLLAERGYHRLELCHFHLRNKDRGYLQEFKSALTDSNVVLQTLLIDSGDITHPEDGERDGTWITGWLDAAHELGAEGARVIAGKQAWSKEALAQSTKALKGFASHGVRIRIENWFDFLQTPEHVHELLDQFSGKVGLCVDLGNWTHPDKYERLEAIAGRAETCHAKSDFLDATTIDAPDYWNSLNACSQAGFVGPYVLVNGGAGGSNWDALDLQRDFILGYS